MKGTFLGCAASLLMVAVGNLHAQVLPPTPTTPPAPQVTPQQDESQRVTATGCLKQERDVPGLAPNIVERAGLGEDFVLTNAKLTSLARTSTPSGAASQAEAPHGVPSAMYRITGMDKDTLQRLVNQQVEVTGRLLAAPPATYTPPIVEPERHPDPEAEALPQPGRAEELQQIRASAIKAIATTCAGGTS